MTVPYDSPVVFQMFWPYDLYTWLLIFDDSVGMWKSSKILLCNYNVLFTGCWRKKSLEKFGQTWLMYMNMWKWINIDVRWQSSRANNYTRVVLTIHIKIKMAIFNNGFTLYTTCSIFAYFTNKIGFKRILCFYSI